MIVADERLRWQEVEVYGDTRDRHATQLVPLFYFVFLRASIEHTNLPISSHIQLFNCADPLDVWTFSSFFFFFSQLLAALFGSALEDRTAQGTVVVVSAWFTWSI